MHIRFDDDGSVLAAKQCKTLQKVKDFLCGNRVQSPEAEVEHQNMVDEKEAQEKETPNKQSENTSKVMLDQHCVVGEIQGPGLTADCVTQYVFKVVEETVDLINKDTESISHPSDKDAQCSPVNKPISIHNNSDMFGDAAMFGDVDIQGLESFGVESVNPFSFKSKIKSKPSDAAETSTNANDDSINNVEEVPETPGLEVIPNDRDKPDGENTKALKNKSRKNKRNTKNKMKKEVLMPPEILNDPELRKYWGQRYRLFSKFDEGIRLDRGKCVVDVLKN
jgi:hypothetical protein